MILLQLTGLPGVGKTTLAYLAKRQLLLNGLKVEVIDGDEFRKHLCRDLTFSEADRVENIRRLGCMANLLATNGIITIMSAINPFENIRNELKNYGKHVKIVWLDSALENLIKKDPKGLYKRAMLPEDHPEKISNLTGINASYEKPLSADLIIRTDLLSIEQCNNILVRFILDEIK